MCCGYSRAGSICRGRCVPRWRQLEVCSYFFVRRRRSGLGNGLFFFLGQFKRRGAVVDGLGVDADPVAGVESRQYHAGALLVEEGGGKALVAALRGKGVKPHHAHAAHAGAQSSRGEFEIALELGAELARLFILAGEYRERFLKRARAPECEPFKTDTKRNGVPDCDER